MKITFQFQNKWKEMVLAQQVTEAVGPRTKDVADAKNLHGFRRKLDTSMEERYTDATN